MPHTIWITGAGGLIGNEVARQVPAAFSKSRVRALARNDLNLVDPHAIKQAFQADQPEIIIHCAAISKGPDCEADPALAWKTNFECPKLLSELAENARFYFFSTDLVFDGKIGNYLESAPVNPLSVYAETKVAAEQAVLKNPRHTVIRTSLNGGKSPTGDRGFNEQMQLSWKRGQTTRLFADEFRCPIAASVTAKVIWQMVTLSCAGLFHLAGAERLSRWQIGQLVAARWPTLAPKVEAGFLKEYQGPPRAPDTSLNCDKLSSALGISLPGLSEWLRANPEASF